MLGEAAPMCQPCGAGCPTGYAPFDLPPADSDDPGCYCLPVVDGCDSTAPACPPQTYCWNNLTRQGDIWEIAITYCYPYAPLLSSTGAYDDGSPQGVQFPNLPPGIYTVSGTGPDGPLAAVEVRITPGWTRW